MSFWKRLLSTWPGRIAAWFVVCTLAGLFFGTQLHLSTKAWGPAAPLSWSVTVRLWAWYEWGLLLPLVFWLGAKLPLPRGRNILLHLLFSLVFAVGQIALNTWTHLAFVAPEEMGYSYRGYFKSLMMFAFHRNLIIYWVLIAGQYGWRALRELHRQRVAAAELLTQLTQARLDALRLQLHPHFLFNTLNAIAALVRRDPSAAERVVNDLSELLRLTLDDPEATAVPFAREVDVLDRYLAIQKVRFGERLKVEKDIAPDTLAASVPPMLLQPIVENSVRHGVGTRYTGGTVRIAAARRGDRLVVTVEDDGPGLEVPPEVALRSGIGLSNTRERLERLYGMDHVLRLGDREGGGTRVTIEIPGEVPAVAGRPADPSAEPVAEADESASRPAPPPHLREDPA